MNFENKVVLITGASRGLGRALALALAPHGARLALAARRGLEPVVEEVRALGGTAVALPADVGDPASAAALAAQAAAVLGPVDVLVHNASDLGPVPLQLLADTEQSDADRAFAVNVLGPLALTRAVVGSMVLRGAGLVLHVSSDAAVAHYPRWGVYGASKAALDHLARTWAAELEGTGVRFLAVDPGEMDTRMHRDAVPEADPRTLARPEAVAARLAARLRAPELELELESGARIVL